MKTPTLSIITGTRNRPLDFRRLVDSIEAHTPVEWELVVSDASDSPIEHEAVATAAIWPRIKVIPERPRKGCTKGYNAAFRKAKGKWVIWLNDDCTVEPGYAEIAIEFMLRNPSVGLGALYYSEAGHPFSVNQYLGMVYANFGIIRKSLGDQIGWFGTLVEMYGCDNVLTFEVLMAGYGVADIPGSRVVHHSIRDAERIENERHKAQASVILDSHYSPFYEEMRNTYSKFRPLTDVSVRSLAHQ